MRVFNRSIFDESISGASTWYTDPPHNEIMGAADIVTFMVHTDDVTGGSPGLFVVAQDSADGRYWHPAGTLLNGALISSGDLHKLEWPSRVSLHLKRLELRLSGTNPQCRLRVYATGRSG